ncbi:MAG: hypothetical protein Q9188_002602 [Gyalolechia gomerana]
MERMSKFRTALFHAANKELNAFDSALKEELASRDESHLSKIQNLQEEINLLRQQASRVSRLEDELYQIRAQQAGGHAKFSAGLSPASDKEQTSATQLNSVYSTSHEDHRYVTFEVYKDCRQQFLDCSQELERVKDALNFWQVEAKRWKLAYRSIRPTIPQQTPESNRQHHKNTLQPNSAPTEQSPVHLGLVESKNGDNERGLSEKESSFLPPIEQRKAFSDREGIQDRQFCLTDLGQPKQHSFVNRAIASEPPSHEHQDSSSTQSSDVLEQHLPQAHRAETDQSKTLETDSDNPVVVLERALKRKRDRSPPRASQRPKLVKEEILSSSPIALHASTATEGGQGSVDLDDISNPLHTPRKGQRKRQQMNDAPLSTPFKRDWESKHQTNNILFDATNERMEGHDHELDALNDKSYLHDGDDGVRDEEYFRRKGQEYAEQFWEQGKRRREVKTPKSLLHNAREIAKYGTSELPENHSFQHQSRDAQVGTRSKSILQPTNANRALPRIHDHSTHVMKAPDLGSWHHGAQYIQSLAEDGEDGPDAEKMHIHNQRQNSETSARALGKDPVSSKPLNADAQQRLDRLLAGPTPNKPPLSNRDVNATLARDLINTSKGTPTYSKQSRRPVEPKTPHVGQDTPWTSTKPRNHLPPATTAISTQPQANYTTPFSKPTSTRSSKPQPSLRSRPLSHLSLNDFKINPKHNQGYEHPFQEVVRKKDQRKCLPGCTRLDCCGKIFRQMAETGLFKPFHTTRLMGGSSQDDDDQTMMEGYLGDQAFRLRKMSKEEKGEVLLQAKTKILADHYGRHREAYAREPSPVGYWDVDMPNSQEAEELGRLAEIRNRQKVEERYREAMRQDGIWKFRDE